MVVLGALLPGCGDVTLQRRHFCAPEVGMTTGQLSACGCVLRDSGGLDSMAEARTEGGPGLRSVVSVTYLCPLGEQRFASVSVTNGIVDAVYR